MQALSYCGVLLLVFTVPGINLDLPGNLGPVSRLLGILVILIWLTKIACYQQIRSLRLVHLAMLLFVLLNLASFFWSIEPADSLDRSLRITQAVLLVVMLWDTCRTRRQVDLSHQIYILGSYLAVFATIISFLTGANTGDEARFSAFNSDPNDMGFILCMGIPWAWQLATAKREKHPVLLALNYAYPAAAVLAIILAGSRGALVAAIPGLVYVALTLRHAHTGWKVGLGVLALAVFAFLGGGHIGQLQRFTTIANSASTDKFTGRLDIWQAGLQIFSKHPLLGVGGGAFPTAVEPFHIKQAQVYQYKIVAHNTYLSVLTELGVVGLLFFLLVLALILREILHQPQAERITSVFTFLAWAVGVFSLTFEYRSQTWLVFGLILLSGHGVDGREEGVRE